MNDILIGAGFIVLLSAIVAIAAWLYVRRIMLTADSQPHEDTTPQCPEDRIICRELKRKDGSVILLKAGRKAYPATATEARRIPNASSLQEAIDSDMNELLDECSIKTKQI